MKYWLLLLVLILFLQPAPSWAQRVGQIPGQPSSMPTLMAPPAPPQMSAQVSPEPSGSAIAAVVNDNVISTSDINDRIKLAMISSGLPDTSEIRQRLLVQILRGLIDEQLQLQEAKRLDISVTKEEIDHAMERIAHDNNIQSDMRGFVASKGASPEALVQQIRAGISWNKVVTRELRPRVEIGDDEIDATIERMRANAGKDEYLVSEIFLAVDTPKDEEQVKQFADNLVQQLKSGGNFNAIARQFSQGAGAAVGGDSGWIQQGQLPPELDHAVTDMQPGQISDPIRSGSGFHIIGLREKRTITLGGDVKDIKIGVQQAFRPFTDDTDKQAVEEEGDRLRRSVTSCADLEALMTDKFPSWRLSNLGEVELAKAPSWISDKVRDLSVGQASEPFATDKGALVLFVCSKHVPDANVNREAIMNSIGTEKLELQARRLLRDLRRDAYLDIRLGTPS